MKFTIDVVPVDTHLDRVEASDNTLSVPVGDNLDLVPAQRNIIFKQTTKESDSLVDGYWLYSDGDAIAFGDEDEISL